MDKPGLDSLDLSPHQQPEVLPEVVAVVDQVPASASIAGEKKCAVKPSWGELASGTTTRARLAGAVCAAGSLLESMVRQGPTRVLAGTA
jgi:hypothetical protein